MNIIQNKLHDFGYLCIEDLYTNTELRFIKNEIKNLNYIMDSVPNIKEQRNLTSQKNNKGFASMTGTGIAIDGLYARRDYSPILSFNRKIFTGPIEANMMETHPSNTAYDAINEHYSLLNRYSHGEEYPPHFDSSSFSAITFFNINKKDIIGGELSFTDYDISFEFKDNFCVIFPSWIKHTANKVKSKDIFRYSLSQFGVIRYRGGRHEHEFGSQLNMK